MQNRGAMGNFTYGFIGGFYGSTHSRALGFDSTKDSIFSVKASPLWGVITLTVMTGAYKSIDAITWFTLGVVLGVISGEAFFNAVNPNYESPSASARPR